MDTDNPLGKMPKLKPKIGAIKTWTVSLGSQILWGSIALVGFSLIFTGGMLIRASFKTQLQQSDLLQRERSHRAAQQIGFYIEDLQRKLDYLARVRGLTELPPVTQKTFLEGLVRHNNAYEMLAILDRQGTVVQSLSPKGEMEPVSFANSPVFGEAFYRQEAYFDNVALDPVLGYPVTTISVPIRNGEDEIDGVLLAKVNLKFLDFVVSQANIGETGYAYVIDARQLVIAKKRTSSEAMQLEDISDRPFLKKLTVPTSKSPGLRYQMLLKGPEVNSYRGLEGVEVLGAIARVPYTDWKVIVELPIREARAPLQDLRLTMLLGLVIGIAVAAGLAFLLSRKLLSPLQSLTAAAARITNGDLVVRLDIRSQNELGVLARAFEIMAEELRSSFTALEKTNQELETRVEQRTNQLLLAKEEAEAAQKIAEDASLAKSEFLANMSHELRTPLNGILGYAQILLRDRGLSKQQKHSIGIVQQCGNHLLNLINDILDLSKIEAHKLDVYPEDFNFPYFLSAVAEMCKIKACQKGIAFNFQPSPLLPTLVRADEKRLRQVLINLLGNAIKFTEEGSVSFKVTVVAEKSGSNATKIRFEIEDTGVGMSPEYFEKIFEPFEQVGNNYLKAEGSGLGLAISQKIVRMMGSNLEVRSQLGIGSLFFFELEIPVVSSASLATSKAVEPERIIGYESRNKVKILVVDDKWQNRSVFVDLLAPIGFEVWEAADGMEGLEKADRLLPDLIIVDLVMPGMHGFDLIKKLRAKSQLNNTVIITSSASVFAADQHKSLAAGSNDFIAKPILASELFEKLKIHFGLEWVYEPKEIEEGADNSNVEELVIPPKEELETVLRAARIGDIELIQMEANRIKQLDAKYKAFGDRLFELAGEFEYKPIFNLVKEQFEEE
jgi:signal transduction histidine kinase/CheY-like chemotaxis protein